MVVLLASSSADTLSNIERLHAAVVAQFGLLSTAVVPDRRPVNPPLMLNLFPVAAWRVIVRLPLRSGVVILMVKVLAAAKSKLPKNGPILTVLFAALIMRPSLYLFTPLTST